MCQDPANARAHPESSILAAVASLRRFGQVRPILVDRRGVIVAGNGVHLAAKRLGWTHIAAVDCDLIGVDRAGYSIADNRIAELSEWDPNALRLLTNELPEDVLDATGWTRGELQDLVGSGDQSVTQDAIPEPPPAPVTRPGDLCFEAFSGSGTQIIVAEQLGRRCYATEISPAYCDVAIERWRAMTGREPTLDGRPWPEMVQERSTVPACPPPPPQSESATMPAARSSRRPASGSARSTSPKKPPRPRRPGGRPKAPRTPEATEPSGEGSGSSS